MYLRNASLVLPIRFLNINHLIALQMSWELTQDVFIHFCNFALFNKIIKILQFCYLNT